MYQAKEQRYDNMIYRNLGKSGLKVSAISLGLWHNFGNTTPLTNQKEILFDAFDHGITYFDLANNYGPEPGSAEENFGKILHEDLAPYRDEMVISSKAGYTMWPGPYGDWGSKKYLTASIDQSLKRTGLDYFDIFYHHRPDPNTPIEETAQALDLLVRQGKALYIGISNYQAEQTQEIAEIFEDLGTPFIVHQPRYNMFDRWIEDGLTDVLAEKEVGAVVFSPLAQGRLTDRYLNGIPKDSRANRSDSPFLDVQRVEETITIANQLNEIAKKRDQSLAQMALAWNLRQPTVSSVIVGASRTQQLEDNIKALDNLEFSDEELKQFDTILDGVEFK
ncbi:hypothetical protein FC70_GL001023 [Paucilactobacillus oligofermentans DSM 15707 = LMG 22743]|uniref:NADP-dependent oxidoreductase domain-containing protein n=1 Tax=Paucilactobacillus oligofermentans DSM 15707 = LMG 22743 TaxID=1423778 RepID=A0A0R1RMK3_9LACO|nr:aldo/keto reductase [Paucilactobacillus oligofermentans]KRL55426.1 hypothetical protein FC70_GL001023 [Paucilactobacillus oligofermentans DSM 15707 = LMG 22743]CUS25584.1 Aldo/keto reductase family protein [Paucilactobacillus oligofermentans DSM 15707 = LMG 22743]